MRFFVKTLTGKTITVEAEEDWTVADVKDQICLEEGVLFAQQKLIVGGKLLEDSTELAELEIMEDSTVDLVVTLCGKHIFSLWDPRSSIPTHCLKE
jgi:hypothetical protein